MHARLRNISHNQAILIMVPCIQMSTVPANEYLTNITKQKDITSEMDNTFEQRQVQTETQTYSTPHNSSDKKMNYRCPTKAKTKATNGLIPRERCQPICNYPKSSPDSNTKRTSGKHPNRIFSVLLYDTMLMILVLSSDIPYHVHC